MKQDPGSHKKEEDISTARAESLHLKEELKAGGTTSGGESGGSPITVLHMQMGDEKLKSKGQEKIEIETQTEQPENEDKETGITQEELFVMAETECRETQVIICFECICNIYQNKCKIFLMGFLILIIDTILFTFVL